MNTAKIYKDSDDNDCSIHQMVKREPQWAANRIQEGEKAIEELAKCRQHDMQMAIDLFHDDENKYMYTSEQVRNRLRERFSDEG